MGQYLKLPKGASLTPGRFFKWVPLATRISCKKTISKKKVQPKIHLFVPDYYLYLLRYIAEWAYTSLKLITFGVNLLLHL